MKDKIPIEKVYLAYHYEATFLQALRRSAEEHGYKGLWGLIRFWTIKTIDYILQMAAYFAPYTGIRVWLHRLRGVKIGRNVHIGPLVWIDDVFPNYFIIEDGVSIAGQNFVLTHVKPLIQHSSFTESYVAPVILRKNAWVTIGVILLPGVTVGEGAVVAAGAVVAHDIPPHTFAAGVPAKVKWELDEDTRITLQGEEVDEIQKQGSPGNRKR